MFFASGPIEAAVSNKALGLVVPPERERMMGYGTADRALATLEGAISHGQYLVGDNFSAADVYVGAQLAFGMMFGMIDKRPAFERYVARLTARPAFARARELDDSLIPQQRAAS